MYMLSEANLSIYYLDLSGTLRQADLESAQIYQDLDGVWIPISNDPSQNEQYVSTPITEFGTYAVFANRELKILIPIVGKGSQQLSSRYENSKTYDEITYQSQLIDFNDSTLLNNSPILAGSSYTTTTDADGNFSFSELSPGVYHVKPMQDGYSYNPDSRRAVVPPDATGQDFIRADRQRNKSRGNGGCTCW